MKSNDPRVYMVLLAGGSGTRLWPLSRGLLPKHLLCLNGEDSLIQQTAQRLLEQVEAERILTVTHEDHHLAVKGQLQSVDLRLAELILAEPKANNTLPAIAWAVAKIVQENPDALVGVFPSDHVIRGKDEFAHDLSLALDVARDGYLVTFGVKPTGPETGYGYLRADSSLDQSGVFKVSAFVEKPDREVALSYLKKGNYYWNSGIFAFRAATFQKELRRFEPGLYEAVQKIVESNGNRALLKEAYSKMKNISIDYGIMEKAEKVALVPASFQWSDLGSWEAIYQGQEKDRNENVIQGNVLDLETSSSLLVSKKGLLATIGLKDVVVVQTDDSVFVSRRDCVQDVKKIVEQLKKRGSPLAETHSTVFRPWGSYTVLEEGTGYKIKRVLVNPGQKLSLQRHRYRAEHWVVVEGTAKVTNGTKEIVLKTGESTFILQGEKHRLENSGTTPLAIIEVQTGSYLGEDDIERLEDIYGRTSSNS